MKYLQFVKKPAPVEQRLCDEEREEKYFLAAWWKYFPYMRWEYFFTVLPDRQTDNIIRELMFLS